MGYMRHHGFLVTCYKRSLIDEARLHAEALGLVVSPVVESPWNGYTSFAVFPDGSKEGWEPSDEHDAARSSFATWLHRQRYSDGSTPLDWIEVQYGDDNGEADICDHSDYVIVSDDYQGPHDLDKQRKRHMPYTECVLTYSN